MSLSPAVARIQATALLNPGLALKLISELDLRSLKNRDERAIIREIQNTYSTPSFVRDQPLRHTAPRKKTVYPLGISVLEAKPAAKAPPQRVATKRPLAATSEEQAEAEYHRQLGETFGRRNAARTFLATLASFSSQSAPSTPSPELRCDGETVEEPPHIQPEPDADDDQPDPDAEPDPDADAEDDDQPDPDAEAEENQDSDDEPLCFLVQPVVRPAKAKGQGKAKAKAKAKAPRATPAHPAPCGRAWRTVSTQGIAMDKNERDYVKEDQGDDTMMVNGAAPLRIGAPIYNAVPLYIAPLQRHSR